MRAVRLALWFAVGLLIGGFSVSSFAVTFNSNAGSPGVMIRSGDGRLSGLNLPGSATAPPSGLSVTTSPTGITLSESGNWDLLDPLGRNVSVPGKQSLTLDATRLSKLAGSAAMLAKGSIQGAIVNYLVMEGISLLQNEWQKNQKVDIPPDWYWSVGPVSTQDTAGFPTMACRVFTSQSNAVGTWNTLANKKIDCTWDWQGQPQKQGGFNVGGGYKCPDGTWKSSSTDSCGQTTKTGPATEQDLQDALYNRTQMADNALKDYYDAVAQMQAQNLADLARTNGTYQASGTATQGPPVATTTTNPDGSTTTRTETPTYNVQSNGDGYGTNQVTINNTTTTTTNNTTTTNGTTTTTTTTTTEQKQQEDYSFTDKDLPPVPDLYKQKYPDGLTGVWNEKLTAIKSAPLFSFVNALSAGAPNGGSCPSWTLSLAGIGKLGSYTLQPPCIIWPFVRWALLITALFVSRRLVFGG